MHWLRAARLDLLRHIYAQLVKQPLARDNVLGLMKAALQSLNQMLHTLNTGHNAPPG